MYKVKIFCIGKIKESYLLSAIDDYTRRLQPIMSIDWVIAKDNNQLIASLSKQKHWIALDPSGKQFDSLGFSKRLHDEFGKHQLQINFVIGGPDGLPLEIKEKSLFLLSLSQLTFTQQLTRLILLEQLYRSCEIQKGSPYHK